MLWSYIVDGADEERVERVKRVVLSKSRENLFNKRLFIISKMIELAR